MYTCIIFIYSFLLGRIPLEKNSSLLSRPTYPHEETCLVEVSHWSRTSHIMFPQTIVPPPQLEHIRGRMCVPIFKGKGGTFGRLSQGAFLRKLWKLILFFLFFFVIQWNLVIKRSDITKPSYNKVILLVQLFLFLCFFALI